MNLGEMRFVHLAQVFKTSCWHFHFPLASALTLFPCSG